MPVETRAAGRKPVQAIYNDYTSTSVDTSAYVNLGTVTTENANVVYIVDTSGQAMSLRVTYPNGGTGVLNYPAGGITEPFPLFVPKGSQLAIKALTGTANVGNVIMDLLA